MSDMPPRPFSAVEDLPTGDPSQQEDYFGFDDSRKFVFPDGKSYIEFKILNEGDRRRFQNSTASDVRLDRSTGNATVRTAAGDQRYELLMAAIVDWNLVRNGGLIPCTKENKGKFLTAANPRIIDSLEKAVRLANPWLLSDMTVEDIDKEIESLQELRAKVEEEEAGKGASNDK
jgi:hypothetical protein